MTYWSLGTGTGMDNSVPEQESFLKFANGKGTNESIPEIRQQILKTQEHVLETYKSYSLTCH